MFEEKNYELFVGNSIDVLKTLPDESVNCCITSPPYYGLRDYGTGEWTGGDPDCPHYRTSKVTEYTSTGHSRMAEIGEPVGDAIYKSVCPLCGAIREDKQIGLEESPEEYIEKLISVFREVKRVLKEDGTLWVNIGDSYNSTSTKHLGSTCKPKDLIGIPWMLAFALRKDGWYLRQDIIWAKPNPMPESVKDRCTRSHEYIFLLSKSTKYFYDYEAIQEVATGYDGRKATALNGSKKYLEDGYFPSGTHTNTLASGGHERWKWKSGSKNLEYDGQTPNTIHEKRLTDYRDEIYPVRNKRDVWTVPLHPYFGAHFATFPENLIEPCILAGSPIGGVVLDVFNGSGTTGIVSMKNSRKYVGIDLNSKYIDMTIERFEKLNGTSTVLMSDGSIQKIKKESLW